MAIENQSTKLVKNFSGITSIEELTTQLDITFSRLFDLLDAKSQTIPLLDGKAVVPGSKAGDLVLDYRTGKAVPMMSDGKNLQPFDHGEQAAERTDANGNVIGYNHPLATITTAGFMSADDKAKLDDIVVHLQVSSGNYYLVMSVPGVGGTPKVINAPFVAITP